MSLLICDMRLNGLAVCPTQSIRGTSLRKILKR